MKIRNLQQISLKNKLKELKQKRLKVGERKGITLIALVITIIVLLILAGVSIATLTGENGILTKANEAKDKTQIADVKEQAQMDILAEQMKNEGGNISAEKLKEILEKYFDSVPDASELEAKLKEEGFKLKSKKEYGGQEIELADIYSGELEKSPITAEELDKSLQNNQKVQYVTNYGIDIDGDGDSTDDWEIFYIEDYEGEDNPQNKNQPTTGKRIFLIASDYVRQDTEALQTAVGSDKANMRNGTDEYEDYAKYWSGLPLAYDCTLPDQEGETKACTFPKLFEFSQYNIKANNTKNNSKCAASLLCTGNWSSFVKSEYADYATGGPSVEMWVDSWNKRHGSEKQLYYSDKEQNNSTLGYYVGTNEKPTSTSVSNLGNSDPLYFPHKTSIFTINQKKESCMGYWIASPSAGNSPDVNWMINVYYWGSVSCQLYSNNHLRLATCSLSKI